MAEHKERIEQLWQRVTRRRKALARAHAALAEAQAEAVFAEWGVRAGSVVLGRSGRRMRVTDISSNVAQGVRPLVFAVLGGRECQISCPIENWTLELTGDAEAKEANDE